MKMILLLFLSLLFFSSREINAEVLVIPEGSTSAVSSSASEKSSEQAPEAPSTQSDHKASILSLEGKVQMMKQNSSKWIDAERSAEIVAGDKLLTGENGSAEIVFDEDLLNLVEIKANTLAAFKSIEPTDIHLEDGTILNILDGLDPQNGYQVTTPTYIAAVRGTRFDVQFEKASQSFSTSSLPGLSGHESKVFVGEPGEADLSRFVEVTQGKQLDLKRGARISRDFLKPAAPDRLARAQESFSRIQNRVPQFEKRRAQGLQRVETRRAHFEKVKSGVPQQGQNLPLRKHPENLRANERKNQKQMPQNNTDRPKQMSLEGQGPYHGPGPHQKQPGFIESKRIGDQGTKREVNQGRRSENPEMKRPPGAGQNQNQPGRKPNPENRKPKNQ